MAHSLEKRFRTLFRSVEGTLEPGKYEHTDHLPKELRMGVTPVNPWHRRILSEIDFCLQMHTHGGIDGAAALDAALTVLEQGQAADGVLTDSVCRRADRSVHKSCDLQGPRDKKPPANP